MPHKLLISWFFFKKKIFSDIQAEIHLVGRNIVSTGQPARALKKLYSGLTWYYLLKCPAFTIIGLNGSGRSRISAICIINGTLCDKSQWLETVNCCYEELLDVAGVLDQPSDEGIWMCYYCTLYTYMTCDLTLRSYMTKMTFISQALVF